MFGSDIPLRLLEVLLCGAKQQKTKVCKSQRQFKYFSPKSVNTV